MKLQGKSALILGASRGIGAEIARGFVKEGARVVLAARSRSDLDSLASELGDAVRVILTDVSRSDDIAAAVAFTLKSFGRLDAAVNNAGVSPPRTTFTELSDETFDATINVNLRAVFVAMKHEIRAMLTNGGGAIVNTGSIGSTIGLPNMAAYVASKHGVAGLTKVAALEYARQNIRVNAVAPGTVLTDMLKKGAAATEEGRKALEALTPMGRIGAPEEIAGAVVFLCSDAASFVTGTVLIADGGYTVG